MTAEAIAARRWYWQRVSGMVLALLVAVHLVTLVYAMRGGLDAAEILARTRGSWLAALYYGAFVVASAIHAPLGFIAIAEEWLRFSARTSRMAALAFALVLLVLGGRAVVAVVVP